VKKHLALCWIALAGVWATAQDAIRNGDPLRVTVNSVRSISPEERVGFSKSWATYRVDASSADQAFTVYCVNRSPLSGKTYNTLDEYVSKEYSALRLWPVERSTLGSVAMRKAKKGRLYRVLIFQGLDDGPHPDLACDMYKDQKP
jgi:hypothetical protein